MTGLDAPNEGGKLARRLSQTQCKSQLLRTLPLEACHVNQALLGPVSYTDVTRPVSMLLGASSATQILVPLPMDTNNGL